MKVILFLTIALEISRLMGPYFLKLIFDKLAVFTPEEVIPILILVGAMFLSDQMNSIINYYKDRKIFGSMVEIENYILKMAQEKLVYLSLNYHEKENTGNKISKIESGKQKITDLFLNMSWEVVPTLFQLVITLVVLFVVDWRFGTIFLFFSPLFIYLTFKVNTELRPIRKKRYRQYEESFGFLGQAIININTVKSFTQEKREIKKYGSLRDNIANKEIKEWMTLLNYNIFRGLVIGVGRMAIILFGVYLAWKSSITIGSLVFVITLSEKAYFSMYRLTRFYDKMEEGAEAVERFTGLLGEKQDIENPKNGLIPDGVIGGIKFKNVNFSYNHDNAKALDDVNLKISSGCVTALVGPSGGGKTTLARMIYRHYDPQRGEVLLDDKSLKEYDLYGFRKFISIVPQEVEIFNLTVEENIAYANPDASSDEIMAAARIANAHEFIEKLKDGYDTEVGERGVKLSGGQRQRIGIARAILANPKILIFDEATSSLDSYSERLIQEAMERIVKNRTTIVIAHRLSTIKKADKIVVLEDGKVAEEGSHLELSRADRGLYAKLLKLQKLGDVE